MGNLKTVINFMQRNDPNGDWKQLLKEYQQGDVTLEFLLCVCDETLTAWHNESGDDEYLSVLVTLHKAEKELVS